jgi:hypothetical protein
MTKDKMLQVLDYFKAEMLRLRGIHTDTENEKLTVHSNTKFIVHSNPKFTVDQNAYLKDLSKRSLIHTGRK